MKYLIREEVGSCQGVMDLMPPVPKRFRLYDAKMVIEPRYGFVEKTIFLFVETEESQVEAGATPAGDEQSSG